MDVSEIVKLMREIVRDRRALPEAIASLQRLVWKEPLTGSSAAQEILRELAYDLEYYEPDPRARAEDSSFYDGARAVAEIEEALTRIERTQQSSQGSLTLLESVVVSRRKDERLAVSVHGVPGWEGFDQLLQYLEKTYAADVVRQVDGPDARRAWLVAGTVELELLYEDTCGSSLIAPDPRSEELVLRIAEDLRSRLGGLTAGRN